MLQATERRGDRNQLIGRDDVLDNPAQLPILPEHVSPQCVPGVPESSGGRVGVGRDRGDLVREPVELRVHRGEERMVLATVASPSGQQHLLLRVEPRRAGSVPEQQERTAVVGGRPGIRASEAPGEGENLCVLVEGWIKAGHLDERLHPPHAHASV